MNFDMVMQFVRYALLTAGPLIIAKGWATTESWPIVVGAMMTVGTWGWGVWVKWGSTSVPDNHAAQADVPTVSPVTGAVKTGPGL